MNTTRAPWSGQTGWHVADWGPWGWSETVVKLIGIIVAFAAAIDEGAFGVPSSNRLAYWLLVAAGVGYVAAIADRYVDREVVAFAFIVATVLGHVAIVYAMGRADWPSTPVRAFASLMLVGDLIKIGFFATTRASVRGIPWTVPLAMTSALAIAYLIVLVTA